MRQRVARSHGHGFGVFAPFRRILSTIFSMFSTRIPWHVPCFTGRQEASMGKIRVIFDTREYRMNHGAEHLCSSVVDVKVCS